MLSQLINPATVGGVMLVTLAFGNKAATIIVGVILIVLGILPL